MFGTHEGYAAAQKIDEAINDVLQKYKIESQENRTGYNTFLGTLKTTLKILNEKYKSLYGTVCPKCGGPLA